MSATITLTDVMPALATRIARPTPLTHLEAQRAAGALGITWGMEIARSDWDLIETAVLTRYGK
ncbi:gp69 [Rhodococcus phage ReqiPine5]|uniref:Gp69 n=1 Tax=Rhodococcus phage ReqiPine5 TaxID=691963 RepID=D4P844_9CAUD|nr:gp69 [Rhodococcus phage ReqiPine5]ADD81174.1 gp69 [Rhodococcus phage ReqiPine5]